MNATWSRELSHIWITSNLHWTDHNQRRTGPWTSHPLEKVGTFVDRSHSDLASKKIGWTSHTSYADVSWLHRPNRARFIEREATFPTRSCSCCLPQKSLNTDVIDHRNATPHVAHRVRRLSLSRSVHMRFYGCIESVIVSILFAKRLVMCSVITIVRARDYYRGDLRSQDQELGRILNLSATKHTTVMTEHN